MKNLTIILWIAVVLTLMVVIVSGRTENVRKGKNTFKRRYMAPIKARNLQDWIKRRIQFILNPRPKNFWEGWRFIHNRRDNRSEIRNWWEGPNICDSRVQVSITTETDSERQDAVECNDIDTTYKCLKRKTTENCTESFIEVRECCKGFMRKTGDYGCPIEVNLKDITETVSDRGLTNLLRAFESVNALLQLDRGSITLFAPSNAAFENLSQNDFLNGIMGQQNFKLLIALNPLMKWQLLHRFRNALLGHVINNEVTTNRMYNEQLMFTVNSQRSTVRINMYESNKIITVNCKNVTKRDIMATNGIVHVVDGLIEPVSESLMEVISKHPRLGSFRTVVEGSGMNTDFTEDGHYTVFAPTDDAFNKTDGLQGGTTRFLTEVLKRHMVQNVICPPAIQNETKLLNLLKKNLTLEKDVTGIVYVNGAQIVGSYIMATNGILYVINDVILPKTDSTVLDIAERENATAYLNYIRGTEWESALERMENIHIFVPSNDAFTEFESSNASFLQDNITLDHVIRYHISPSWENDWYNNYQMDTFINERKIRINHYAQKNYGGGFTPRWTAQCSTITKSNLKSDNGFVHIIDKVLLPPNGTIMDVLKTDGRFDLFVRYLESGDREDTKEILQSEGQYTVFAPTDYAFDRLNLSSKSWEHLNEYFHYVVHGAMRDHIINDVLCCASMSGRGTDDRNINILTRNIDLRITEYNSTISVGGTEIKECDIMGTNGVIHAIDEFLPVPYIKVFSLYPLLSGEI